jgi:hypothetical protein
MNGQSRDTDNIENAIQMEKTRTNKQTNKQQQNKQNQKAKKKQKTKNNTENKRNEQHGPHPKHEVKPGSSDG